MEQLVFTGQMYGLSRHRARKRSMDLLIRMGLQEKKTKLASTLSGGMKRRLNLCLALVHDPEIVVLDEPEAGLDPQSRLMVREFIRELGRSKTVILTTHNMDEADRLADRIAIMDHGQILIRDTPVNLKRTTGESGIIQVMITPMPGKGLAEMDLYLKAHKRVTMVQADRILIRETADPEILWHIYKDLKDNGFNIAEISLRQPTLEDVFIGLTGRNLRDN
jgi:ABC-2 type transport system ATP-binding protein